MIPHKHAALIKAWADGAKIQYKRPISGEWIDIELPVWYEEYAYRIKPTPKTLDIGIFVNVYKDSYSVYNNRAAANNNAHHSRITCLDLSTKYVFNEGE